MPENASRANGETLVRVSEQVLFEVQPAREEPAQGQKFRHALLTPWRWPPLYLDQVALENGKLTLEFRDPWFP